MNRKPTIAGRTATACVLGTALTSMLMVLVASPASAGGWWTYPHLDTEPMSPGEEVTASATVMFPSAEDAEAAGAYYAYLVRGIDQQALQEAMGQADPEGWWSIPEETVLLGRIEFGETDTNLRRATVSFVVPDIESGAYSLMFCTRGCAEPLGDVIPREGLYVGDPVAVRLIRESRETDARVIGTVDGLEEGLQRIHRRIGDVGTRVEELDTRAGEITRSVDGVERSLSQLGERVEELEAGSTPAPGWLSWAGWFLAGLALAIAWSGRRAATEREADPEPDDTAPVVIREDEQELAAPEFVTSL